MSRVGADGHRRLFRMLVLLLLPVAIFPAAIGTAATTLVRMSVEQMSQTAPVIVRARCLQNVARWEAGEIWTFSSFAVEDVWKGAAPAQITVRLLGGTAGHLTSTIAGIPRFRPGEVVVLFLEPSPRGDLSVVSWQQGTFRMRVDARSGQEFVTQDTASFATFDPASRRFEAGGVHDMPLAALRQQVRTALGTGAWRQP